MTSRRLFGSMSGAVVGLIALASSAQAAPEAQTKAEGQRRPSMGEPRAVGEAQRPEQFKGKADKRQEKEHHHGRGADRSPPGGASASGAPLPAPSGSAGPEGEPQNGGSVGYPKLHEQRISKLRELRGRWGRDTLKLPSIREELEHHAWRSARLNRMRVLATEKKNEKLLSKLDKLEQKENERHEKAMTRLKEHGSRATPQSSAGPVPSGLSTVGQPHKHGTAKKANAGGNP